MNLTRIDPRYRQALTDWLSATYTFDLFVTLTTNSGDYSRERLRDVLREWDQRMNRKLFGPKWHNHQDELLWTFSMMEKPSLNAHWHLLIRRMDPDDSKWSEQVRKIRVFGPGLWQKLVPEGRADVKVIDRTPERLIDYVTKELGREIQYEDFITPDELRLG